MKVTEIKPRTFIIDFETRQELLKTFIRFQEYYESPEFKDKVFTVEEYADWYVKHYKKESFTYYDDWSGCNVPSFIFEDFRSGKMNPLSKREIQLLEKLPNDGEKFYVIGTFQGGQKGIIEHEICHSLYYSNSSYKYSVDKLLSQYDGQLEEVKKYVLELGYHQSVLMDEVQAYISGTPDKLKENNVNYPEELHKELKDVFKSY
jgi:hypothetical protein